MAGFQGFDRMLVVIFMFSYSVTTNVAYTVTIGDGEIRGYEETVDDVTIGTYLGIPYAEPPVGHLRFRRPQPVKPWEGVLDATNLPNSCSQFYESYIDDMPRTDVWLPNTKLSEDCLYLNVWTPKTASAKAVMVWIHGGAFTMGTSTADIYNGKTLAVQYDVVVVSMQYRLGALGFLFLDHEEAPGNMGLLDQQLALRWVAENIRSFGGDPDRVTLFGESAGGASVGYHLLSPGSASLFKYAILQSGAPHAEWGYKEALEAEKLSKKYARQNGCDQNDTAGMIKCLKSAEVDKLSELWGTILPTKDGIFIKDSPTSLMSQGEFKQTDIMIGVTSEELSGGIYGFFPHLRDSMQSNNFSKENFHEVLSMFVKESYSDKVIEAAAKFEYENMGGRETYLQLALDSWGDSAMMCFVVGFADSYVRAGNKVYMFILDHRPEASPLPEIMGCTHGTDIFYTFGSLPFEGEDDTLRKRIQSYWSNFAKIGSPDDVGETTWPTYSTPDHTTRVLDLKPNHVENNFYTRRCAFWNVLVPEILKIRNTETCDCS